MSRWLTAALDYIPRWIEFQMRLTERPGCAIAIAHRGRIVLDQAFGFADATRGVPLTARHRFRVASHSKSFTAAGIMRLREQDRLRLDDQVGQHVQGLHPAVAEVTIAQLLSHSAGIIRDGADTGQWVERRPFADADKIRADLAGGLTIEPSTRFKYSNHGYGLIGFVIEAIAGEPYGAFIKREIVDALGLEETAPDVGFPNTAPLAHGHGSKLPLGRRVVIRSDNSTNALAAATGFVSTAADLARFFGQLSPTARGSVLSAASRREMIRPQWRDPYSSLERYYGLGITSGTLGDWEWFGHGGGFPGVITRTTVLPNQELTVAVLTNASDGLAHEWTDGTIHVLRRFARDGAPSRKVSGWAGRWWTLWRTVDLVPVGDRILAANPAFFNPFVDAGEIAVTGRDRGRIALAGGFASHGEEVRRGRNRHGKVTDVLFAGMTLSSEAKIAREIEARYERRDRKKAARRR
jgi:CubicO group peptidase (beta-lactamase class C family)